LFHSIIIIFLSLHILHFGLHLFLSFFSYSSYTIACSTSISPSSSFSSLFSFSSTFDPYSITSFFSPTYLLIFILLFFISYFSSFLLHVCFPFFYSRSLSSILNQSSSVSHTHIPFL
jgi:hypothetical protein